MTLLEDVNRPGSQKDLGSNWEPAHSLVEDAISGAEIAPHLSALAVAHLPLCLQRGKGPVRSRLDLLWYSLGPLFCERARLCFITFCKKVLSLSLSFPPTVGLSHSLGCYLTLVPKVVLRAFRPSSYPKQAARASLFSPRSLLVDVSVWATSLLGVVSRHVFCGFCFFFFFSQLCCLLRFQKSSQTCL